MPSLYTYTNQQMWIEDADGNAHPIADVAFTLEGVDVAEINDPQEYATAYAGTYSEIFNETAIEDGKDEMTPEDCEEMAGYIAELIEYRKRLNA